MPVNKTIPTDVAVETFLNSVSAERRKEANTIIDLMSKISGTRPVMWGPSIIGFGTKHYKYDTGREGDMPQLAFSPRKASITIYFNEGFSVHSTELKILGKHKHSVSCLYINKLTDINVVILRKMLEQSFIATESLNKPKTVDEYIANIPNASRPKFDELRQLVRDLLPSYSEVLSYGIIGYKIDDKRPRVFISGWKDHVAIYPVPKDDGLKEDLKPYIKGKGTIWFELDKDLPVELIKRTVQALAS